MWVIIPQEGDTVGQTFVVDGRDAFRGQRLLAAPAGRPGRGGRVHHRPGGHDPAPYSFEVTAVPGDYMLRVYDADMSGAEGNGEAEDTKRSPSE